MAFYCEVEPGAGRRDVTLQGVGIIISSFAVPFLLGLGLTMWAIFALVWNAVKKPLAGFSGNTVEMPGFEQAINFDTGGGQRKSYSSTVVTVNGREVSTSEMSELPPETAQMIKQVLGGLNVTMQNMGHSQSDLADRLQQLQEARDKGLITADEYERVRQAMLDNMRKQ